MKPSMELGYLRRASTASWFTQATWVMRLWFNCEVYLKTMFCPHPAALLPTVSIYSGRCGRLCPALMRCTSSFWWSWGEFQVVGRSDRYSILCCAPALWWSGIEYSCRHVCPWGGVGLMEVRLHTLHSAHITSDEYRFPPSTWGKYIPWWFMYSCFWWRVEGISPGT